MIVRTETVVEGGKTYDVSYYGDDNENFSYYCLNQYHRLNGPAVQRHDVEYDHNNDLEHPVFIQEWWNHGRLHRLDGPAVEKTVYGRKYCRWFYKGEEIDCNSQKEFEKKLRLKAFW